MLRNALYAVLLLVCSQARADYWSNDRLTNSVIIASNVLTVMDWAQTRHIADNPERFMETGPAADEIGIHPTTGEVNRYFIQTLIVWNGIGYFLPDSVTTFGKTWSPKQVFYISLTAYEGSYVMNNRQIGIRMQF